MKISFNNKNVFRNALKNKMYAAALTICLMLAWVAIYLRISTGIMRKKSTRKNLINALMVPLKAVLPTAANA